MAGQMPRKMEEQLFKLDHPEEVKRIQLLWNDYLAANNNYALAYPEQFANLVDGNRRFGEQKSIPTPAEQLRMYESIVMTEIDDLLQEQDKAREEVYELDEVEEEKPIQREEKLQDFQLTSGEIGEKGNAPDIENKERDINQSQDLNITWLKEYRQSREAEQIETAQKEQPAQGYDFKLVFNNLEEIDRDDIGIEPEDRQKEDMDLEYE